MFPLNNHVELTSKLTPPSLHCSQYVQAPHSDPLVQRTIKNYLQSNSGRDSILVNLSLPLSLLPSLAPSLNRLLEPRRNQLNISSDSSSTSNTNPTSLPPVSSRYSSPSSPPSRPSVDSYPSQTSSNPSTQTLCPLSSRPDIFPARNTRNYDKVQKRNSLNFLDNPWNSSLLYLTISTWRLKWESFEPLENVFDQSTNYQISRLSFVRYLGYLNSLEHARNSTSSDASEERKSSNWRKN